MKHMNIEYRVQLTKSGALYLNLINKDANDFLKEMFVNPALFRIDYKEHDYFCSNLLFVTEIYMKTRELGLDEPFISGTIEVLTKEVIASCENDKEN